MGVFDLFSKRQKQERGEAIDVFRYDELPTPLRWQLVHILNDTINYEKARYLERPLAQHVMDILTREYGVPGLPIPKNSVTNNYFDVLKAFLVSDAAVPSASVVEARLDLVETSVAIYEWHWGTLTGSDDWKPVRPDRAIDEINYRMNQAGVGYQLVDSQFIRVDSQILHREAVLPTLLFLSDSAYSAANQEFLSAHEHYRHRRYVECCNECLKAFESTLKVICTTRQWKYAGNAVSGDLIRVCKDKGMFPPYTGKHLDNLLEIVSIVRSVEAAHGAGTEPKEVPEHLASYMLHLTATNILFLVQCEKALN